MTLFTIAGSSNATTVSPAVVDARSFSAFTKFLRDNSQYVAVVLWPAEPFPSYDMEVRVCPWSLATLCALFDDDEAVIAVIEEAQFLRRRVRISRIENSREITLSVADTIDMAVSFKLDGDTANELLAELDISRSEGQSSFEYLRDRLSDPRIVRRLATGSMSACRHQLDTLASMLETEDDELRLVWV